MARTASTFAGELRHFARSVDIVDNATFDSVRNLIYKYVRNELDAEYFELLTEQIIDKQRYLRTMWSNEAREHLWPLGGTGAEPTPLVSLAFDDSRPLWVVTPDREPIQADRALVDQWSSTPNLPPYQASAGRPVRTVVVVPLRRKRISGVFFIETGSYVSITDVAQDELRLLGDAISILYELWDVNKSQSELTREAIDELTDVLQRARFPKLAKPGLFLAYSGVSDQRVTTIIQEVLDQYSDKLEIKDWGSVHEAGNITVQIARDITRSKFGICYLSQPSPDGTHRYVDNPNVVFEAGMLHALTNSTRTGDDSGGPGGWIPIREKDSPPAPFDFSNERIVVVPRRDSGELNEARFRDLLQQRVNALLLER